MTWFRTVFFGDNQRGTHSVIVISNYVDILALVMLTSFLLSFDFLGTDCSMNKNVQSGDMCPALKFRKVFFKNGGRKEISLLPLLVVPHNANPLSLGEHINKKLCQSCFHKSTGKL